MDRRRAEAAFLMLRFAQTRDRAIAEEVIALQREILADCVPGTADHREWSGVLGRHLQYLFQLTGDESAQDEAVELMREAITEPDADLIDHQVLGVLTLLADQRFQRRGDRTLLSEVGMALARALDGKRHNDPRLLEDFATVLRIEAEMHESAQGAKLLERAIGYAERAVAAAPDGRRLADLGTLKALLHNRIGGRELLDSAVETCRRAVEAADDDQRPVCLNRLQVVLSTRYQRHRHLPSLAEAITIAEAGLALTPKLSADYFNAVVNVGSMRGVYSAHARDRRHAEGADRLLTEALAEMPSDHFRRAEFLMVLAQVRMTLADLADDDEAIDRAMGTFTEAMALRPPDSLNGRAIAGNLAGAHLARHRRTGDTADLDKAIDLARQAIDGLPRGHPARIAGARTLFRALFLRPDFDPAECAELGAEVAADETGPTSTRIEGTIAVAHAERSRGNTAAAVTAARAGVDLLSLLAWRGGGRQHQERMLAGGPSVTGYAAQLALADSDPRQAVEILEHGRGVLMAQALETRTALDDLPAELAARLDALRAELDSGQLDGDRRQRIAGEWHEALAEARALPGFEDFLRPARFAELADVGSEGPVVLVHVYDRDGAALVIENADVRVIRLPGLDQAVVDGWLTTLSDAVGIRARRGSVARRAAERALAGLLDELARVITAPVLAELGPRQRIWWCPTAGLSFLPLHAACLDQVTSSYLPNLGALRRARAAEPPAVRSVLSVGAPGEPPLPDAEGEARLVHELHGGHLLLGDDATPAAVLARLPDHSWAHFACHGAQDPENPSSGRLRLSGGALTLTELTRLDLPGAELAYLSACQTAVGGRRLPDEAIHLAGALQLAGFRQVIGTLWTIMDGEAAVVAEAVHRALATSSEPLPVAEALREATLARRAEHPDEPTLWAAGVHFGP